MYGSTKNNLGGYFTAKYRCHRLVYYEQFANLITAIDREKEIKGWRREKKNKLVRSMNAEWKDWQQIGTESVFGYVHLGIVVTKYKRKVPPVYSRADDYARSLNALRDDDS